MPGVTKGPANCLRLPDWQAVTLLSESNQFDRPCHAGKEVTMERKTTELGLEENNRCL